MERGRVNEPSAMARSIFESLGKATKMQLVSDAYRTRELARERVLSGYDRAVRDEVILLCNRYRSARRR